MVALLDQREFTPGIGAKLMRVEIKNVLGNFKRIKNIFFFLWKLCYYQLWFLAEFLREKICFESFILPWDRSTGILGSSEGPAAICVTDIAIFNTVVMATWRILLSIA